MSSSSSTDFDIVTLSGSGKLTTADLPSEWSTASSLLVEIKGYNEIDSHLFSCLSSSSKYQNINFVSFSGMTQLSIGEAAFYKSSIVTLVFPSYASVTIGEGAFCYCSFLNVIKNLSNVTSIGRFAFYYNSSLTNVNLLGLDTSDEKSLGNGSFYNCGSLAIVEISPAFYQRTHRTGESNVMYKVDKDDFNYYDETVGAYSHSDTVPDTYMLAFGFKCDAVPPGVYQNPNTANPKYNSSVDLNTNLNVYLPGTVMENVALYYMYYFLYTVQNELIYGKKIPGNTYTVRQLAGADMTNYYNMQTWEWYNMNPDNTTSDRPWALQAWLLAMWVWVAPPRPGVSIGNQTWAYDKSYPLSLTKSTMNSNLEALQCLNQFQFVSVWNTPATGTTGEAQAQDIIDYHKDLNDALNNNDAFAGGACVQNAGSFTLAFAKTITNATGNFGNLSATTIFFPNVSLSNCNFTGNTKIETFRFAYGYDKSTSLPHSFFKGCSSLKYINLPKSITSIGYKAFYGCSSLIGSERTGLLNLEYVTEIGQTSTVSSPTTSQLQSSGSSFANCSSLLGVVFSMKLSTLGPYSFSGCSSLLIDEDTLPKNTTFLHLQPYTFENCTAMDTLTIPPNIEIIDTSCFSGCTGLETVYFTTNSGLTIGESAFAAAATIPYINLPPSVTSIGKNAFYGMKLSVLSMSINYFITPTTYSSSAISNANANLVDLSTPSSASDANGYTKWMYDTFGPPFGPATQEGWYGNDLINFADGVKVEYYYTFGKKPDSTFDMTTLTSEDVVYWMNEWELSRVFTTGKFNAFIDQSITSIGDAAFSNCDNITTMSIHVNVKSIGRQAFMYCSQLTTLFFGTNLNALDLCKLESIGDYAFAGCSMQQVILPPSVTSIGRWCFYNSQELSNIIFFRGSTIQTVEDYCFANCSNLSSFKFPSSVTTIGDAAFRNCTALQRLVLPPNLVSIGKEAFMSCSYVSTITIPTTVRYIGPDAFSNAPVSMSPSSEEDTPVGLAVVPYHAKATNNPLSGKKGALLACMTPNNTKDGVDGTYSNIIIHTSVNGGVGDGAVATVTVIGGIITSILLTSTGSAYHVGDQLYIAAGDLGVTSTQRDFILNKESIIGTYVPLLGSENSLMASLVSSTNTSTDCQDGIYNNVVLSTVTGNGKNARATVKVEGNVVTSVTVTVPGTDYSVKDRISVDAGVLGSSSSIREFILSIDNLDEDILTPKTIGNYFNAPSNSDSEKQTLYENYIDSVYNYNFTLWLRHGMTQIASSDMGEYWKLEDRLSDYDSDKYWKDYLKTAMSHWSTNPSAITTARAFVKEDTTTGYSTANEWVDNAYFTMKNYKMLLDSDPPTISPIPATQVTFSYVFSSSNSNGELSIEDVTSLLPQDLLSIKLNADGSTYNGFVVSFDDNVLSINDKVFENLPVQSITSFNNITSIGDYAFHQCITLQGLVNFPATLKTIGISAFQGTCINNFHILTNYDDQGAQQGVESIGASAFQNAFLANSTISIPKTVTSIGNNAFGEIMSPFSSPDVPCTCTVVFDVSQVNTLATNYTDYISVGVGSATLPSFSYTGFLSSSSASPTQISGSSSPYFTADLATYEVTSATMQGGYTSSRNANVFRVPGSSSTYIAAANDGSYTKMVQFQILNENGKLYAYASSAAAVSPSLGSDVSDASKVVLHFTGTSAMSEPVATSSSAAGYGISALTINKITYSWVTDKSISINYSANFEPATSLNSIVAVGTGTSSLYYSTDGGVQWTGISYSNDPFVSGQANCVASDGHKFYAGGYGFIQPGNGETPPDPNDPPSIIPQLAVSVDLGKTWSPIYNVSTSASSPFGKLSSSSSSNNEYGGPTPPKNYGLINGIAYSASDNVWIAGGSNGNNEATLGYSTNGGSKMSGPDISSFNLSAVNSIACGNGIVVAACTGGSGHNNIIYSESYSGNVLGKVWNTSSTNIFGSSNLTSVVYNGSIWVASAMDSKIFWSADGVAWEKGTFSVTGQPAPATPWYTLGSLLQANSSMTQDINIMSVSWNGTEFLAKAGYFGMGGSATTVTDVTSQDGISWTLPNNVQAWEDTTQNQAFLDTIWTGSNWISVGFNTLPVYSTTNTNSQSGVTWNTGTLKSSDSDSDSDNESVGSYSDNYYTFFGIATVHALPFTSEFAINNGTITQEMVQTVLPSKFFFDSSSNTPPLPFIAYVGPRVYDKFVSKKDSTTIPISIGDNAFSNTSVRSLTLDNVKYIGISAFSGCNWLSSADLSYNTEFIEPGAFTQTLISSCNIPVPAASMFNTYNFPSMCAAQFYVIFSKPDDGTLTELDVDEQLSFLSRQFYGKVVALFDPTIKIISNSAFKGNKFIYQVLLSPYIEFILQDAFKECPNLTTLATWQGMSGVSTIQPNLVYIGKHAFNGNSKLVSVSLPSSLNDIETGAFLACPNLWKVQLPVRFYYDLFVMYNLYFESNMMKNQKWKSDAQWSATGTFFTFNFQENGQTVLSYSYAKQHYMATQRAEQANKVAEHDARENSKYSPLHILEDIAVIGVAAIGAVTLAPALLSVGGAAYSGVADLLGFAGADAIKDAVVPVAEGGAEGAGDAAASGGSDAVGQAPANAPDLTDWDEEWESSDDLPINTDTDKPKPNYMITADQADFIMSKEGIAAVKDPTLKAQLEEVTDFTLGRPNDEGVLENFNKIKNYAPKQILPEDVVNVLSMNIRAGTSSGLMRALAVRNIEELRLMVIDVFEETGMITDDGANQYLNAEKSGALKDIVDARNEAVTNAERIAQGKAPIYSDDADTMVGKFAKYVSNNKAQLARDFAENYWQNVVVMATVMPLWDYLSRRGKWFQYPVMATVSTTAISNLLSLTNNYGNMNSIYSPPSTLSPIPASYTSHTAGSWIVTTIVTYSPVIQVNVDPVFTAFKEAVKEVLGEITFHKADLSFTHSTTKQTYNKLTFKLTMNRDYESVTTHEKEILTNTIDAKLSEELDQYVLPEDSDVTTTTMTTPPNNPALYPQLLGGGPSTGYSPKLVLLSEGGADRAQSRFMLRTGWNNALDSGNTTSFASVNNTGNKNYVRDSSNFIKYRKLRAINQNYNDLKK
jgi:hypothetical protein